MIIAIIVIIVTAVVIVEVQHLMNSHLQLSSVASLYSSWFTLQWSIAAISFVQVSIFIITNINNNTNTFISTVGTLVSGP